MAVREADGGRVLLACVGGSAGSRRSIDHLIAVAGASGSRVRLLVGRMRPGATAPSGPWTAGRVAAHAAERMRRSGIEVEILEVDSLTAAVVAPLAEAADLVVVAREGANDRLPEDVMAATTAPLLVVHDGPFQRGRDYRLVAAVRDLTDVEPVVRTVGRLAGAVPVTVMVVHVHELRVDRFGGPFDVEDEDPVAHAVARLIELGIPAWGQSLAACDGRTAEALALVADDWDATMVVVNSRRPRGFLGRFLPSTGRDILRYGNRAVLMPPLPAERGGLRTG